MPFFVSDPAERAVLRTPSGRDFEPQRFEPSFSFGASFRLNNPIASAIAGAGVFPPDPDYRASADPDFINTDYFRNYRDRFIGSQSADETRHIMAQIDREQHDREASAGAGILGLLADTVAGSLDPTILFPAGTVARAVRGGVAIGRSAARTAGAVGAQVAGQEAVLQATQETRTLEESALAIGTSTLLGGLIGGGVAGMLSRGERRAMMEALDRERQAAQAHIDAGMARSAPAEAAGESVAQGGTGAPSGTGDSLAASAGAAATDTRAMEPVGFLLNRIPGWSRFAHLIGTDLGVFSTGSVVGKRLFPELVETTQRFKQNLAGEVTSPVVPLDREIKLIMNRMQVRSQDEIKRLYSDYFFGEQVFAPFIRAQTRDILGSAEGKLSPAEFEREVATAMQSGDTHAIPQVAEAAQFIRRELIDPYAKRLAGANPDFRIKEFGPGESYFPYRWMGEQIKARPTEFVDDMLPHFIADQNAKAAAKERMSLQVGALQVANDTIAKLTRELEVARGRLETTEIKAGEAGAGTRAVLEPSVRRRTNVLADRASGQEAKIADLEERLVRETENVDAIYARLEQEIADWQGKSVAEAKAAIKAREKYRAAAEAEGKTPGEGGRLRQADDAIDSVVRRIIESDRDLSVDELRAKIEEIKDHIVGTPIGRIPYDIAARANETRPAKNMELRGQLLARDFDIPYPIAAKWLDHDLNRVLGSWMRTVVPDTLLWERYPGEGPALTSKIRQIQEEYNAKLRDVAESKKSDKAKEKKSLRLNAEKDRLIATISGVLDRMRGIANPSEGMAGRVGEGIRMVNQMTDLGMAAVTSIPDFAGPILHHGLSNVFRDGYAPLLRYLQEPERVKWARQELRDMGVAVEMAATGRGHALAEISEAYVPKTTGEKMLKAASDKFFLANLQAPETQAAKEIAGSVVMSAVLRAVKAEAEGKATKKQVTALRESNISKNLSERIWREFNRPDGGKDFEGTRLPNTRNWQDERARMHFIAAVARDVDRAVVTPGQEKPLLLSTNAGSLLGQYKSFAMAATNKLLISNIQRADAQTLQGVLGMVALGMISYKLTSLLRGQKTHDRPQDWVKEGINRSGLFGIFEDVNMFAGKATRGTVDAYRLIGADKPLSRNANRTILSSLLGPTAGKIENITRVTGAIGAGEWTEADTHAVRRSIALQNLWGLHMALDGVERGFNGAFGIPMRER